MDLKLFCDLIIDPNDFESVKEIGSGSFAYVTKVKNKKTGEIYAMKESKKTEFSITDKKLFINEIVTMATIKHPAILSIGGFSFPTTERGSILFTEFAEGGDLSSAAGSKTDPPKWLNDTAKMVIMCGITAGIAQLHSKNIIHRDLKPANILLTEDHLPKIADFGIAKFAGDHASSSLSCGTRPYMAPEVLSMNKLSSKADIYALGFILFELLTHRDPFACASNVVEIAKGKRTPFPKDFNQTLRKLIESLWAVDANARPSAYQVLMKLRLPEYWLPSTDSERFIKYYDQIIDETEPTLPKDQMTMKLVADKGDPLELYNLGLFYLGRDFHGEMNEYAIKCLRRSAKKNFTPAMYELAILYEEVAPEKSFELMEKAANKLFPKAIYKLALYKRDGIGCEKSGRESITLLMKAGNLGYTKAFIELGNMKKEGNGIRKDTTQASFYYKKAEEYKDTV